MSVINAVLQVFKFKTDWRPIPFGLYHIVWLILTISACILIAIKFKNATQDKIYKVLFYSWLIMFVFEVYKQITYSFSVENGSLKFNYDWKIFPFQFCSTPLYVLPLILLTKNTKLNDYFVSFTCFFALFGGLIVMAYPVQVFTTSLLGVLIQTMLHHALMITTSILCIVASKNKLNYKFFLKGVLIFVIALIIAQVFNDSLASIVPKEFNMFYVSKHTKTTLVILKDIYDLIPYFLVFIIYLFGFILIAFLIYLIAKICYKKVNFKSKKRLN